LPPKEKSPVPTRNAASQKNNRKNYVIKISKTVPTHRGGFLFP
jgi:hypothetical protein